MRSGRGLWTWVLVGVLGLGSLAAGFGAGRWWLDRDTAPQNARWALAHTADSAQLTPASQGLFTLTMSPSDAQVLAVRQDAAERSQLLPLLRLESEWEEMFGSDSVPLTLLVHDASQNGGSDSASIDRIELRAAQPVVDGDMVTYPVEVIRPTFIAEDAALRAFTEVTLVLPNAQRPVTSE